MSGSNYRIMGERAREHFLTFDQEEIIRRWKLKADENIICFKLLGQELTIDRKSGMIGPDLDESEEIHLRMIVYDVLTRPAPVPEPTGRYVSLSELGGIIGIRHENTLGYDRDADYMSDHIAELEAACEALGGVKTDKADVSCIFPLLELPASDISSQPRRMGVWFRFWEKDEEFPAQIRYQWDANILKFMYYETVWYVIRYLTDRLLGFIRQAANDGKRV